MWQGEYETWCYAFTVRNFFELDFIGFATHLTGLPSGCASFARASLPPLKSRALTVVVVFRVSSESA
jgi:hypothetical protein